MITEYCGELKLVTADYKEVAEFGNRYYGHSNYELTNDDITALLDGKYICFTDNEEYTFSLHISDR